MSRCRRLASRFGWIPALAVFVATTVGAQDADLNRARARELFSSGVSYVQQTKYEEALAAFQEAYRLAPHPSVRLNMAHCYEALNNPIPAIFHYESYLSETETTQEQRVNIEASIDALETKVGTLVLDVSPDGSEVVIDGIEKRTAPIHEAIRLAVGVHHVSVRHNGYVTAEKQVMIWGGTPTQEQVTLQRTNLLTPTVPKTQVATRPAQPIEPLAANLDSAEDTDATQQPSNLKATDSNKPSSAEANQVWWPVVVSAGVSGAALLSAVITGVLALSAENDFENVLDQLDDPTPTSAERLQLQSDGEQAADRADRLARTTDILWISGAAFAVSAILLHVVGSKRKSDTSSQEGRGMSALKTQFIPLRQGAAITLGWAY